METASAPPRLPESTAQGGSLAQRLMNVFAAPGDVFEEVKGRAVATANWLVPVVLLAVFGVVNCVVVFSQETVLHQMREIQERAVEKKIEKLPEEQKAKIREMQEKFSNPTIMKILTSLSAVTICFIWLFFVGFVVWLLGARLFKGQFSYLKAVEVCGLAGVVDLLSSIVGMLLVVITGNMFVTLGPSLLIREFDPTNKLHLLLSAANVMTFWYIGVLALGVAKLSNVSFGKAALWLLVPWLVVRAALILSSVGQGM